MAVSSKVFVNGFLTSINFLTAMVTTNGAVGQSPAQVSQVQVTRQGGSSATLQVSGTYTSFQERLYRVQIQTAGTGLFGSALWRWSDTGGVTWNAENLPTFAGVPVLLSHGVSITLIGGGPNPQFVTGDSWDFYVHLEYGPAKAVDLSRETEYRSGTVPNSSSIEWRFDFGGPINPTVFALLDENIPSNGSVVLRGKTTGFTDPPDFVQAIPAGVNGRRMALLSAFPMRYWRVIFTFVTAPALGYLRLSEMCLGLVNTFARQFLIGFRDGQRTLGSQDLATMVRGPSPFQLEGRYLSMRYPSVKGPDLAIFQLWRDYLTDRTVRTRRPVYFVRKDDDLTDFGLFQWANDFELDHRMLLAYGLDVELAEVIRTFD